MITVKTDIVGVEEGIDHGESKLVVPLLRYSLCVCVDFIIVIHFIMTL